MAKKQAKASGEPSPSGTAAPAEPLPKERDANGVPLTPTDGLLARRLRAARKKAKRADEIEALKASGREINPDQEEALKGKAKTLAAIDELEKLAPLLREAVAEEVGQRLAAKTQELEDAAAAAAAQKEADQSKSRAEAAALEASRNQAAADELRAAAAAAEARAEAAEAALAREKAALEAKLAEAEAARQEALKEGVGRVVQLLYFAKLFSKDGSGEAAYIRQMERDACLTYDSTVTFEGESLTAADLDAICAFGNLVTSRPLTEIISHQTALERCRALALDWVHATNKHIPQLSTTVNELVLKFERIVGSDYYSIKPEIKGAAEVGGAAAAAAFGRPAAEPQPREAAAPALGGFGGGPPAGFPGGNNSALQQLLSAHRPSLASTPSAEHALPNGFVPSLSAGFLPTAGVSFLPAAFPGGGLQPPGFEPGPGPERPHLPDGGAAGLQFFGAAFQGPSFGAVGKPEPPAQPQQPQQQQAPKQPPAASANGNGPAFMAPETPPAPPEAAPAPSEPSPPAAEPPAPAERKPSAPQPLPQQAQPQGPGQAQGQGRPRVQPIDAPRARGPGRGGRGPPQARGSEFGGQRGGGGGGGSRRGYRGGRGPRDFQQQQQQQQQFAQAPIPPAGAF